MLSGPDRIMRPGFLCSPGSPASRGFREAGFEDYGTVIVTASLYSP